MLDDRDQTLSNQMKEQLERARSWIRQCPKADPLDALTLSITTLNLMLASTTATPQETARAMRLIQKLMSLESRINLLPTHDRRRIQ